MGEVVIAAAVIGGMGAVLGLGLSYASRIFAVEVDEKVLQVREILPGANCGACGFAGCDAFADAVVDGTAEANACPVGGDAVAAKVANILGIEAADVKKMVARVLCNGHCEVSTEKYIYQGMEDCTAAVQLFGGHKSCAYGCLGRGSCVKACPFQAIVIKDGIARIIEERCRVCGKCVAACPKMLIALIPQDKKHVVMCRSRDKGPVTKKYCSAGCIGCTRCVKACSNGAISMEGSLAVIDYDKCINCGECIAVCPTGALRNLDENA